MVNGKYELILAVIQIVLCDREYMFKIIHVMTDN